MDGRKLDSQTKEVAKLECTVVNQKLCLSNASNDKSNLCFYTGFTSCTALVAFYTF